MGFVEIVLLIGIIPLDLPVTDTVSQIEINHFYCPEGKHIFDQVIAKDFNKWTCQYECRAWWLVKREEDLPSKHQVLRFDGNVMRLIRVGHTIETWTQYDPELENRKILPVEKRRPLTKLPDR